MSNKVFSQRFNSELSRFEGFPQELPEKIKAVKKVFGVTRQEANAMISGNIMPADEQLYKIAEILEVCPQWLKGETDRRKPSSGYKESMKSML